MKCCQTCINSRNNPSRCPECWVYVGRKDPACNLYIESPTKMARMAKDKNKRDKNGKTSNNGRK